MKIIKLLSSAAILSMLVISCGPATEIAYIHDAQRDSAFALKGQFSGGIQANDLLGIYVESETPESTIQFNQETNKIAVLNGTVMNPGSSIVSGYLVNHDGDIIFPVLGKLHVVGLTHSELAALIESRLVGEGHIADNIDVELRINGVLRNLIRCNGVDICLDLNIQHLLIGDGVQNIDPANRLRFVGNLPEGIVVIHEFQQLFAVGKPFIDAVGGSVAAQNNTDQIQVIFRAAGNQTIPGLRRISSFHPRAVGDIVAAGFHQTVGVAESSV